MKFFEWQSNGRGEGVGRLINTMIPEKKYNNNINAIIAVESESRMANLAH